MSRRAQSVLLVTIAALLEACGGELACGEGTAEADGTCVPAISGCGPGTVLRDGTCVPESQVECGAGSELVDGVCRPSAAACAPGTSHDATSGRCVPDVTCRADQVPLDGYCVSQTEVDRSMADVMESSPDANDPAFDGTPEALVLPAMVGDSTIFAGVIDAPTDLDGDGVLDQDVDAWAFTASAGDVVQISLRNLGDLQLGFRIEGPNGFWRLSPLHVEAEPSRFAYLPYDGEYVVHVGPQATLDPALDAGPAGGLGEAYVGVLSNVGPITPRTLGADAPVRGVFPDLRDQLFQVQAEAGELRRVVVAPVGVDVVPTYLVFDGDGAFLREERDLTTSPLFQHATAADDLRVLVDYTKLVGLENDFEIVSEGVIPTDLGALDPAASTFARSDGPVETGEDLVFTVRPLADSVIEIAPHPRSGTGFIVVSDASGEVASAPAGYRALVRVYRTTADPIVVRFRNTGYPRDFTLTLTTYPVVDLGTFDTTSMTRGSAALGDVGPPHSGAYLRVTNTETLQYRIAASQARHGGLAITLFDTSFETVGEAPFTTDRALRSLLSASVPFPGVSLIHVFSYAGYAPAVAVDVTSGPPPVLEAEPNDTVGDAQPLTLRTDYVGSTTAGDADFVRVALPTGLSATELLQVRVTSERTDDWTCRLWDSTGTSLEREQTPRGKGCLFLVDGLVAGDYLVEVRVADDVARGYVLRASVVPGVLEAEPNDTSAAGTAIDSFAVPVYGEVASDLDEDAFALDLPAEGFLSVQAEALNESSRAMTLTLTEPSGGSATGDFRSLDSGGPIVVGLAGQGAGSWTATVRSADSASPIGGWYRLTAYEPAAGVTDEVEGNDAPGTANTLAFGTAVRGRLTAPTASDDDYYALTLPTGLTAGQSLVVRLYRAGADPTSWLQLAVLDADGTTSLRGPLGGLPRSVWVSGLAAGTYYVRVSMSSDTTLDTDYVITATVE